LGFLSYDPDQTTTLKDQLQVAVKVFFAEFFAKGGQILTITNLHHLASNEKASCPSLVTG
jgi:hypothetical protein